MTAGQDIRFDARSDGGSMSNASFRFPALLTALACLAMISPSLVRAKYSHLLSHDAMNTTQPPQKILHTTFSLPLLWPRLKLPQSSRPDKDDQQPRRNIPQHTEECDVRNEMGASRLPSVRAPCRESLTAVIDT